jgi:hypothetical protein
MALKLSELIARYGDDRVQFQNLDHCVDTMNMGKKGTKITFGTEQKIGLKGTEQLGLVVWLDRERVAEIVAENKALAEQSPAKSGA